MITGNNVSNDLTPLLEQEIRQVVFLICSNQGSDRQPDPGTNGSAKEGGDFLSML